MASKKNNQQDKKRLIGVLKVACYITVWLIIWCIIAFVMMLCLLAIQLQPLIAKGSGEAVITPGEVEDIILVTTLAIATIFFIVVWLLRKTKSMFMRISRMVLLVCTCIGLVLGVVMAFVGEWGPTDAASQEEGTGYQVDTSAQEDVRRWQYMLCSNGTYRYYTDEQFKDPQVGFTEESEDACEANGAGAMTKLADAPPQTTTTQATDNRYQDYVNQQKKTNECYAMWDRYYTYPRDSLAARLGGKPSTAHIIHYIGTDQYKSVVAEYNAKAREWNATLKQYEQDFKNSTIGKGCDMSHLFSGYRFDEVSEYNH